MTNTRRKNISREQVQEMVQLVLEGTTRQDVADLYGLHESTVTYHISKHLMYDRVAGKYVIRPPDKPRQWGNERKAQERMVEAVLTQAVTPPAVLPHNELVPDDVLAMLQLAETMLKKYDERHVKDTQEIADLRAALEAVQKEARSNLTDALSWREHRHREHERQRAMSQNGLAHALKVAQQRFREGKVDDDARGFA